MQNKNYGDYFEINVETTITNFKKVNIFLFILLLQNIMYHKNYNI